ncbi:YidH family protein [Naumannella cuiyingiana]|uniref:Uncharacterized membrane protein YidH (DUF202 family) n=1 Tax=Naumannella cuiyingiana TaxID=1347891 RepID=A0A7Z0D858_9ACTN|nr:DUF202 domain-containing protein [Naumannella cuiyingiana]NYI70652.1 uncharacterized membrane protein YidH (DUF202 family) [Naumannella cuiyingiana]
MPPGAIPAPWDPGLQNERTRLAWQRTALSLLVATLVMARLLAHTSIPLAIGLSTASVLIMAALARLAERRYRLAQRRLHANAPLSGAGLPAAMTALLVLLGVATAFWVINS